MFSILILDGINVNEVERKWEEIEIPVPWGIVAGNNKIIKYAKVGHHAGCHE